MTLQEIQREVADWSFANFGTQVSKITGAELGSLAPLLGLFEEYAELIKATEQEDDEEIRDALGDIGVYLCDFCSRDQALLPIVYPFAIEETTDRLLYSLGELCHVVLKHHQGIRGYDNLHKYTQQRGIFIRRLLVALNARCLNDFNETFDAIVETTWTKVKQRNWAKHQVDAHTRPCG